MADQGGRARGRSRARATAPDAGRRPGQQPEQQQRPPPGGRVARGAPTGDSSRPGDGAPPGKYARSDSGSFAKRPRPSDYPGEGVAGPSTPSSEMALAANVSGISLQAGDNGARGGGRGAWRGRDDTAIVQTRPATCTNKQGKAGEKTTLMANYFKLRSTPNWAIYHYHVDFSPSIEGIRARRSLVTAHRQTLGNYLFDGMGLFTINKLEHEEMDLFSDMKTTGEKIKIHLKLTRELPPTDSIVLQIMNIQMRKNLRHLDFQQLGRYYFDMHAASTIPHHNLELWPGYITAIHQHENSVMMCADLTFKILRCDTVLDQLRAIHHRSARDYKDIATRELVGCIVLTRYNNKTYRIDDIDWDLNPTNTFDKRDGTKISFRDYYRNTWNLTITDGGQPMLISRPKKRDEARGMAGPIILVPEVCVMTGLNDETRANFSIMRDIATHTRVGPGDRVDNLNKFMGRLQGNDKIREEMEGWSLSFDKGLITFQGRNLPAEKIFQGQGKTFGYDAKTADWSRDMRSNRLLQPISINQWVVITMRRDQKNTSDFLMALSRVGPPMGINITRPNTEMLDSDRSNDYTNMLQRVIRSGIQLVMCIVPNNRKDRYDSIKKMCCLDMPVPSQVIQARTISKTGMHMSVATKVAIQLNCKLGGSAWCVEMPLKNIMIVGYDSYHDSSKKGLSVGAICCSLNHSATKYFSAVTFQTTHQEMIEGFNANLKAGLMRFRDVNGALPERVFIYRDGVGEGQLQAIRDFELAQVHECFKQIGNYNPRMAFVVVTKRINTRLFEKKNGYINNPTPGTVADSEITRPEWYDFFLVSQSVRQGTVAPTSYNVIYDTSGLQPDHMQRLTYKLTHLYFNWPGTVRVPAPCLYAHKLAFLTGQSLHRNPSQELADTLFFL